MLLRRGAQNQIVETVVKATGATGIYWSRRYTPWGITDDAALKSWARRTGLTAASFAGSYTVEPWAVQTKQGSPFKVFTPFYKAAMALGEPPTPAGGMAGR